MDNAYVSAIAALAGSAIGAIASFVSMIAAYSMKNHTVRPEVVVEVLKGLGMETETVPTRIHPMVARPI